MRLFFRRDTYSILVFAPTSLVYFGVGMIVGRGLFRTPRLVLLIACGFFAVVLINGFLWGIFALLRRFSRLSPSQSETNR